MELPEALIRLSRSKKLSTPVKGVMNLLSLRIAALGALCCLATASPTAAEQRLDATRVGTLFVGTYRLVSYVAADSSGMLESLDYSAGRITYDETGHMMEQLARGDRPRHTYRPLTDAERATAYASYMAYLGTYEVDTDKRTVTHHVDAALDPNMVGTHQVQDFEFSADGNTLTLTIKSGDQGTGTITWERFR